ncbi:MAG TPA: FlgD immunoglobulin-like domain containing protein, partial [Candidatus Saccharimonadales bacterium]|nr:FlgD immunoglobulin-like domain containing protein [Candidatus Saccharimonadales bacterium]
NRPNPFNPHTEIRFELARGSRVALRVFDVNGRLVRILADTEMAAGSHRVPWDGTDAAGRAVGSGTYLYRLDAAGFTRSRKMVLLR